MRLASLRRLWFLALGVALLLAFPLALPVSAQDKPVARFYLFYSQTCPHCHEVMQNYLPKVYAKYGDQVEHQDFDIYNNNANYVKMLGLEQKLGVAQDRQGLVPVLIIGDRVLLGQDEIPAQLEGLIDGYLAQGGVDYPSLQGLPTPAPAVEVLAFFDSNHADFERLNNLVTQLQNRYGDAFLAYAADLSDTANVDKLKQLHAKLGLAAPKAGAPELLIDHTLLVGIQEIEAQLPALVDKYLAQGGVAVPSWDELLGTQSSGTPVPTGPPIYIAFFEKAGCQECARTTYDLQVVRSQFPQTQVESFAIEDAQNKLLNEWLCEKMNVPVVKRLTTPMLFIGSDVLIGAEAGLDNILATVSKYTLTGAERTWDGYDQAQAKQSLVDRFKQFGVLTVLGAGLIDGLNPCAFATLIFFISYMTFTGRRGRDILLVGVAFALGVFITYFVVGVALAEFVKNMKFLAVAGRWVYVLTAILCVSLAALTFRDYLRARKGQAGDMTLKLPAGLRKRIHKVIREGAQMRAFVAVAFVTGVVVSFIELACTGQVYLPTILYVLSVPTLAARAVLFLFLYCVMFIVPLIVVFVLSYFGTTSQQLAAFVGRHTATAKLLTGLLFTVLAGWMTWAVAKAFSLAPPWNWVLVLLVLAIIALGTAILRATAKKPRRKPAARRSARA